MLTAVQDTRLFLFLSPGRSVLNPRSTELQVRSVCWASEHRADGGPQALKLNPFIFAPLTSQSSYPSRIPHFIQCHTHPLRWPRANRGVPLLPLQRHRPTCHTPDTEVRPRAVNHSSALPGPLCTQLAPPPVSGRCGRSPRLLRTQAPGHENMTDTSFSHEYFRETDSLWKLNTTVPAHPRTGLPQPVHPSCSLHLLTTQSDLRGSRNTLLDDEMFHRQLDVMTTR